MNPRQHVRQTKHLFFPRWDRDGHWRIQTWSRRILDGRCDRKKRVIETAKRVFEHADPDRIDLVLIHEFCHAVYGGDGKVWQGRMKKASERAQELGRNELAKLLLAEIVAVQQSPSSSIQRKQFYEDIQNYVLDHPNCTLPQVITLFLADRYGLHKSEVRKIYPRTERVFREAKLDAVRSQVRPIGA
jgi:hypothetical protein